MWIPAHRDTTNTQAYLAGNAQVASQLTTVKRCHGVTAQIYHEDTGSLYTSKHGPSLCDKPRELELLGKCSLCTQGQRVSKPLRLKDISVLLLHGCRHIHTFCLPVLRQNWVWKPISSNAFSGAAYQSSAAARGRNPAQSIYMSRWFTMSSL